MEKINKITELVKAAYKQSSNEAMSQWFYEGHVKVVANYATEIAEKVGANSELSTLAALFHDIARTWSVTEDPALMDESISYAEKIMLEHGYSQEEISQVKEAILPHSCKKELPTTEIGKILATADALAHLMTDFYSILPFYGWLTAADNFEGYRQWLLEKIERDFNTKIFYEEYKEKTKLRYEALKTLFSKQ
ncbi:MAG: HD domain-containing protein [Candidatus Andersenbacteria bacterium]|nr:HD domain-containing protein [Candidatus Andersenbacteria bacterium]